MIIVYCHVEIEQFNQGSITRLENSTSETNWDWNPSDNVLKLT